MKTAKDWINYLTNINEGVGEINKAWLEGFVCGLVNSDAITTDEEDQILLWIHKL